MTTRRRFALPLALLLAWACQPRHPQKPPPASRLDAALAEREKQLAAAQRSLLEAIQRQKPSADQRPLDTSRTLAEIRRVRKALARITLTEDDTSALRAYCRGNLAQAEDLLEESERARPGRAFPPYLLAAIALERGRLSQAARNFRRTLQREPESRTARLLARLTDLYPPRRHPPPPDLCVLFEKACRDVADELALNWPAQSDLPGPFPSPLLADPLLLKAQEVVARFARDDLWDLADRMEKARDPEEKLRTVLMMGENLFADALLHSLARDFPQNPTIHTFLFFYRNFARRNPRPARFADELAAARKRDPENGVLILLAISPGTSAAGNHDYPPLDDHELAEFTRGVRAPRFLTFVAFAGQEIDDHRRSRLGPFAAAIAPTLSPFIHPRLAHLARRAAASVGLLLQKAKTEEALRLASDIESLAQRLLAESKEARVRLVADAILDALYETMGDYAARAAKRPLLLTCLERRAEIARRRAHRMLAWDQFLLTMARIPVPTLASAAATLQRSSEAIEALFHRKLAVEPERYFQRAMTVLSGADTQNAPAGAAEWLVVLAELRNRNAVPLLIRLAGHRDPLIAHLATAAFEATAEGSR